MNTLSRTALYFMFFATTTSTFIRSDETLSYLPVVLVAGINGDHVDMQPMANLIKKYLPNVYVKNVQVGLGKITSFWNMREQAEWLAHELYEDYNLRNGCNIIAHSQGGLTARYFIQRFNYPHVYNYIALGAPQRGVDGIPTNIETKYMWLNLLEPYVSNVLYIPIFQECVSFAGYWNDSLKHTDYLNRCTFLPYLNNEKSHDFFDLFKENIGKLENMVLVKSVKEDIVEPAESCHFGFYKQGTMWETEDLFSSNIYIQDTLGLKQLYADNRLHLINAQCSHDDFKSDEQNFIENILPFLTTNQGVAPTELVYEATQPSMNELFETLIDELENQWQN